MAAKTVNSSFVLDFNTRSDPELQSKFEATEATLRSRFDIRPEQTAAGLFDPWKDEYTLVVVSIPAVLAFVRTPWLDGPGIVSSGFDALTKTPLWYQGLLLSLFLATVGIRYWRRSQSDT